MSQLPDFQLAAEWFANLDKAISRACPLMTNAAPRALER